MAGRPALVVFLGGLGRGRAESLVATARWAASLDSIETALHTGAFAGAVLVTDDAALAPDVPGAVVDVDDGAFHFGRRLANVLRRHGIGSAVYMGGGSLPLLPGQDFSRIASRLRAGVGVTNNSYSADLVGFAVTNAVLAAIEGVERDNALARALAENAGLAIEPLPRSVATQMDIDSPGDLAVLSLTRQGGVRLQAYLQSLEVPTVSYRRVLPLFLDPEAQVIVAGRVGSHAWQYLERETACRVRLFAEERGMEAEGRAVVGAARSLLGFYLAEVGAGRLFEAFSELGDAAFIDTRVLLAHERNLACREDRFLSDLGCWQQMRDPFLREFTRAASEASIPVILGGHSLMSGGLMLLNEFAWQESETKGLTA
jgi:CTP:molybdopterin cytidylyltransferase MocA